MARVVLSRGKQLRQNGVPCISYLFTQNSINSVFFTDNFVYYADSSHYFTDNSVYIVILNVIFIENSTSFSYNFVYLTDLAALSVHFTVD